MLCRVALGTQIVEQRINSELTLLGLTLSGLFMGLSSSLIYTSELILCSTIVRLSLLASRGLPGRMTHPGFCSVKRPWEYCYFPLDGMLVYLRVSH